MAHLVRQSLELNSKDDNPQLLGLHRTNCINFFFGVIMIKNNSIIKMEYILF